MPFPFDAVLWDIDGTLADSEPTHEQSFFDACAELGITLPADFQEHLLGSSEETSYAWLQSDFGLEASFEEWTARRYAAYLARAGEVDFHPEARPLWEALAATGIAQGTVSNSARVLVEANLAQLGIAGRHESVARDDVARGKPAPDPYLLAARRMGLEPARIAVVEDSATGMASGRAAGMQVFMMPHFRGAPGPDWQPVRVLKALAGV